MEVTKPLKPLMERVALGDLASLQAVMCSKHRAGPETADAGADPPNTRGRLIPVGEYERTDSIGHCRGSGDSMQTKVDRTQHGKPHAVIAVRVN